MHQTVAMKRMIALCLGMSLAWAANAQQAWPSRPITIIVPYTAGAAMDVLARIIGPKLTERWGQPVIVENRPGGNTAMGNDAFQKSKSDGYTLLFRSIELVVLPLLQPSMFDTFKNFTPVATISSVQYILSVNPSVPVKTLQELTALAKAKPGELNYASSGMGSPSHIASEMLAEAAGINITHIPYPGSPQTVAAIAGGHVQTIFSVPPATLPLIKAAKITPLAVTGASRLTSLPDVPTFAEAGLPNFQFRPWMGLIAPAGTPKEVVDKIAAELALIVASKDFQERLETVGLDPFFSDPDQFAAILKSDALRYADIIRTRNIKFTP